jgi:hypothetical protein
VSSRMEGRRLGAAALCGRGLCALVVALALVWPAAAAGAPTVTEFTGGVTPGFSANGSPDSIAAGPDGNVWFTEFNSPGRVGRITPAGAVTEFTGGVTPGFSANGFPVGIAAGPDGALWFTERTNPGRVGRITPAGAVTEFAGGVTPGFSANRLPDGIAAGPDGNLWFTERADPGRVGRITPAGAVTEFTGGVTPGFSANGVPFGIAAGPDGALWFTELTNPGRVGRITAGPGAVTGAASGIGPGSATLAGGVRPNGQLTVYHFEYGPTSAYGSQTTPTTAGAGVAEVAVAQEIAGLAPDTLYHYRLTATNDADTTTGADRTFTTTSAGGGTTSAGGGATAAPPGGGLAPPAKASFAGSRSSITVNRKRSFKFSFVAPPGLTGVATFASAGEVRITRKARVTLARKPFTVPPTGKVTLTIKLSRKSFRILKLNHKLRVLVTITLTNAAGLTSEATNTITLKPPQKKRRR